jgi:hypothetical protein
MASENHKEDTQMANEDQKYSPNKVIFAFGCSTRKFKEAANET